jgi:radical SAM superfamily enzyme YgiQ (UPF0313 family)
MKITLINPSPEIWIEARTLPLGLAYIAATLEKEGHKVEVIDLTIEKREPDDPDLVGITATTPLIHEAWEIAKRVKEAGALTVLGGPHPSSLPGESLSKPYVDFVVRGEGEITMKELCRTLEAKGISERKKSSEHLLKGIKGISYRKEGKIIHNPDRPYLKDLDSLPFPAYHLFPPLKDYTSPQPLLGGRIPAANIITSRGCPYNCNFCYKGTFGNFWRARSPENVIEEWSYLIRELKVKEIGIQDDLFNLDRERCLKICRLIRKERLNVPWSTPNGLRADRVDKELLLEMKRAGCYRVAFGVESGDQGILDRIGKKIFLEKIKEAFRLTKEVGLKTIAFFMMGNLGETRETMEKTIKFARELKPDYAQFSAATPFPGTALYQEIKEKGKFLIEDWKEYSQFESTSYFEYEAINQELVEEMLKKAYRQFYLRPGYLLRFLLKGQTWRNLPRVFKGGFHFLKR